MPSGFLSALARRYAAERAARESRLRRVLSGDVWLWSGPTLHTDRWRAGRLPREDDGGPSWDDAVRLIER